MGSPPIAHCRTFFANDTLLEGFRKVAEHQNRCQPPATPPGARCFAVTRRGLFSVHRTDRGLRLNTRPLFGFSRGGMPWHNNHFSLQTLWGGGAHVFATLRSTVPQLAQNGIHFWVRNAWAQASRWLPSSQAFCTWAALNTLAFSAHANDRPPFYATRGRCRCEYNAMRDPAS